MKIVVERLILFDYCCCLAVFLFNILNQVNKLFLRFLIEVSPFLSSRVYLPKENLAQYNKTPPWKTATHMGKGSCPHFTEWRTDTMSISVLLEFWAP
nr:MAG TPA: hypothetical protein [Caudoviricetes sp.]